MRYEATVVLLRSQVSDINIVNDAKKQLAFKIVEQLPTEVIERLFNISMNRPSIPTSEPAIEISSVVDVEIVKGDTHTAGQGISHLPLGLDHLEMKVTPPSFDKVLHKTEDL